MSDNIEHDRLSNVELQKIISLALRLMSFFLAVSSISPAEYCNLNKYVEAISLYIIDGFTRN